MFLRERALLVRSRGGEDAVADVPGVVEGPEEGLLARVERGLEGPRHQRRVVEPGQGRLRKAPEAVIAPFGEDCAAVEAPGLVRLVFGDQLVFFLRLTEPRSV